jgi:hypothetical protein
VTCYTQPCKPCEVTYILHYLPQGGESSPRGSWGICAPALPEVLTIHQSTSPISQAKCPLFETSIHQYNKEGPLDIAPRPLGVKLITTASHTLWSGPPKRSTYFKHSETISFLESSVILMCFHQWSACNLVELFGGSLVTSDQPTRT